MQNRVIAIARNPVFSTAVVCLLLYLLAGFTSEHFFSSRVAVNLLQDNAYLGIVAVGVTFVILTGGIDLSVGAIIGWTTITVATLITNHHWNPYTAMLLVLAVATLNGAILGSLIHFFAIPFLPRVTPQGCSSATRRLVHSSSAPTPSPSITPPSTPSPKKPSSASPATSPSASVSLSYSLASPSQPSSPVSLPTAAAFTPSVAPKTPHSSWACPSRETKPSSMPSPASSQASPESSPPPAPPLA